MPLIYLEAPKAGAFRQGEILANVWEHRAITTSPAEDEAPPQVASMLLPVVIVLSADCDLEWDYQARLSENWVTVEDERADGRLIPYLFVCDLYTEQAIRQRSVPAVRSDLWRRIQNNQDERYHYLAPSEIGASGSGQQIDGFVLDFKKSRGLSTESLYEGLMRGHVQRMAVMPPIYLHDLMHRFYGFLSRIGLPD